MQRFGSCMDAPCLERADSSAWSNARGNQAAGAQGSHTRARSRAAEDAEAPGAGTHRGSIIAGVFVAVVAGPRQTTSCKGGRY
jgi:hypothetical protein